MSRVTDELESVRKIVLVSDICSSTGLLEDLVQTENQERWRNLLIRMKKFLMDEKKNIPFEIYKFTGDGWILLFDYETLGEDLIQFLERLCSYYLNPAQPSR